ncbi:AMP-dependent synthetase/ligase [Patulibacter defluvii]|uniref:AMP-dependent synthetase/ligase n=1 Tax=Patulibacter defluvii TaxID=3095358 RepID=UPI002A75DF54|nr:AMP-dependent synthetase/ligase [Patulibacter sp. DM4]
MTTTATVAGTTIADFAFRIGEAYGDRPAARYQTAPGDWTDIAYADLSAQAIEFGSGLLDLGLDHGDRVAVLGSTRPLWSVAHLGLTATGAVHVSVYPTNAPEECAWVVGNSQSRGIVCEDAEQVAKIQQVRDQLPALEWIVILDGEADGAIGLDEVRARGRARGAAELRERAAAVTPDDAYMFMYTSGTTGPPKGCVLSHGNYRFILDAGDELSSVDRDSTMYLFLPLAHAFALLFHLIVLDHGAVLVYWGGDTARIVPELAQTRPTILPSVPRIFEKIYAAAVGGQEPEVRERMLAAARVGLEVRERELRGEPVPDELRAAFDAGEQAVFAKVRGLFGGNLRRAISGGAPLSREIAEFLWGCGVPVTEGFGMTETSTAAAMNTLEHHRFGTVGRSLPGQEAAIAADGELLLRGPNIFQGYHGLEQATREAIDEDGWLHTGDLGAIDEDGYISIVGRKKDIIITAGGKNLTPANFENDVKRSKWVSQAVMHGDRRPYPVALITLDPEAIVPWARERGLPTELAALADHDEVRALVQADVDRANAKLARVEQVKKFALLPRDLSQEEGELTPTLKVKRKVVDEHFAEAIEALYA